MSKGGRKIEDVMQIFANETRAAQKFFGFTNWDIHVRLGGVSEDAEASCSFDLSSAVCTMRLSDELDIRYWDDDWYIKDIARHEMLHLMFAELQVIGTALDASSEPISRIIHNQINRIVFALSGVNLYEQ